MCYGSRTACNFKMKYAFKKIMVFILNQSYQELEQFNENKEQRNWIFMCFIWNRNKEKLILFFFSFHLLLQIWTNMCFVIKSKKLFAFLRWDEHNEKKMIFNDYFCRDCRHQKYLFKKISFCEFYFKPITCVTFDFHKV